MLGTQAGVDEVIRRAEAGGFNAIFANVFTNGRALFETSLVDMHPKVKGDFNPLPYLVQQAHQRNIEVHAWFVNGPVSYKGAAPILDAHPDWAIEGPDGKTIQWLNFTRPDVRQFLSDLMWEAVDRYGVDGVHFDYTRYPGPEWGFDAYSVEAFSQGHDFSLDELRYDSLPAYGPFKGRSLAGPTTAQVLARFSNGVPAVTLNRLGRGQVLLLNWDAIARTVGIGGAILQHGVDALRQSGGQIYLLKAAESIAQSGEADFDDSLIWLNDLDRSPQVATNEDLPNLAAGSIVILPGAQLISADTAAQLAAFVRSGGGLILLGGMSRSIQLADVQALTGMSARGDNFDERMLMTAVGDGGLIPVSDRPADLALAQARETQWNEFRMNGINALVEEISTRLKTAHPNVAVTVTITSDRTEAAQRVLQDWRSWLDGGYVDALIPRAYVDSVPELQAVLDAWQPDMQHYGNITLGLISFAGKGNGNTKVPKPPEQLQTEIQLTRQAGSAGLLMWVLDELTDEQLAALGAFFASASAAP